MLRDVANATRTRVLGHRIRVFDPNEVTRVSDREVPAADVDLDPAAVPAIWRAIVGLYRTGLHPAIGVCIRYRGAVILDRTIGHARGNGTEHGLTVATPDTLFNLFSASKPVTAMLVHHAIERGLVGLDDPICQYIDGFERHGKHGVTVRHVLCHRAGIPVVPPESIDLDMLTDRQAMVEVMRDARLVTEPGSALAYHALSGGFVLAEVLRQVTGEELRQTLQRVITGPLAMRDFGYGVPPERLDDVAIETFTGAQPPGFFRQALRHSLGVELEDAVSMSNDPRFRTGVVPSGNVIGTPNEVCRFFEMLRGGGTLDGVQVFEPDTVRQAFAEHSFHELDQVIKLPVRYGLGFMLGGERLSFYGPGTPEAFGHLGFTNVLGYADPERDLSVAFMNSGKPFITPQLLVWLRAIRVIAARIPRTRGAALGRPAR